MRQRDLIFRPKNCKLNNLKYSIWLVLLIFLLSIFSALAFGTTGATIYSGGSRANQAPQINITSPSMDANVSGIIEIKGYATDDVAVKWVNVVIKSVHYNATDTSGNGSWYTWNYSLDTTKYSNGGLRIAALAHDGELASDTSVDVNVNNTKPENKAPKIWIEVPGNNTEVKGTITFKGHATDDVKVKLVDFVINSKEYQATDTSGNNSWWSWKLGFDTTKLDNGKYWVTAWAWDDEILGGSDKILIIVNNTENHWPYVNITHPKNEATVSGIITITGHAWDIDGNVTSVWLVINGTHYNATDTSGNSSWYTWSLNFNTTILKDGEYKIKVLAKDDGDKLGDEGIWIIVKNTKENKEPHVTITHPKNEATVNGTITIKGNAWDDDGSIKSVKVRINEVYYFVKDTSGNGSWYSWSLMFNTSKLKDGEYRVTALAMDNLEKLTDAHIWIIIKNTVENKEPHIEIFHPKNVATVKGIFTIKGHAWDSDGNIVLVQVKLGDNYHNATDNSGNSSWYNWSFQLNTTTLKDGEHKIIAIAKDNQSKLGDDHIWVNVKNKLPSVQITSPTSGSNVSGVVNITGKAFSPRTIKQVQVKIGDKKFNATDSSGNGTWYSWYYVWNTSAYENGSYKITAIINDGVYIEDSHVKVKVKNVQTQKEKPKKKKRWPIPGFELPLALIAVIVVVVCFFRSGRRRAGAQ